MERYVKILFLSGLLFICRPVIAQVSYSIRTTVDFMDYLNWRKSVENGVTGDYVGSPYLNDNFVDGKLYYNKEYLFQKLPLRYNIYDDVLEFMNRSKGIAYDIDPTFKIDKAIIGKDTFVVDSIQLGKKVKNGYFIQLRQGKITLLKKLKVTLIPEQPAQLYNPATPPEFARNVDTYYARIGKNLPEKVKNIKSLIKVINDKKKALSDYAKKEKLPNNTEGMIKLAKYYESL